HPLSESAGFRQPHVSTAVRVPEGALGAGVLRAPKQLVGRLAANARGGGHALDVQSHFAAGIEQFRELVARLVDLRSRLLSSASIALESLADFGGSTLHKRVV